MTDEEINDAVILKMGWVRNTDKEIYGGYLSGYKPLNGRFPPNFCKSIDAAWEIVEKFQKFVLVKTDRYWFVKIEDEIYGDALGKAETAPKAICLAFLKLP